MKKIIFILMVLIMPVLVNAQPMGNTSFLQRIISDYKVTDNGICDDGENLLLDKDCMLTIDGVSSGNIFFNMWAIRLVLIIGVIMLIRRNPNLPIVIVIFISLLALNGAFGRASPSAMTIEPPICDASHFLGNFGGCIWPTNPVLGWFIGIAIVCFLVFWPGRRGNMPYHKPY